MKKLVKDLILGIIGVPITLGIFALIGLAIKALSILNIPTIITILVIEMFIIIKKI